ncbi:MAG: gfo/Idh/MocA family oxidoreductase [Marinilabiliales bacterium]|nr:MAG: gfo/Idh/MocA family oxidoreductase [Marinilabiliales bacterium]
MNKNSKDFSRRKFIGDAAAIGALGALGVGSLVSSCQRKPQYTAPVFPDQAPDGPPLKAGLVGCGDRGTGAAFDFLSAGPNLQIVAMGDVFQDRLDRCRNALREHRGVEIPDENCFLGFDSFKKVIDSDIDVVLLCQPTHFRPESLLYAVQARKHVFAEKCVGVDPVGVRSVMASGRMAEAAGLNVVVGTQRRHQRDYVKTFEMIKNGAIGDLISANCYWNQGSFRHVYPREGWSDMEAMIRDFFNWCWLSGDHILDQNIHNIDIIVWFFEKYPVNAVGFGGRHRRPLGDQYDFFSVDFAFDDGRHFHAMCRQIDGCANNVSEMIYGTKGYTNCRNRIWDYNDNLIWEYEYPMGDDGTRRTSVAISPYVQEHINLVTAIRTGNYINEVQNVCESNMAAIMGRESAYTGRQMTWDDMMNSNLRLGPTEYSMGPVDIPPVPPVPGTSS